MRSLLTVYVNNKFVSQAKAFCNFLDLFQSGLWRFLEYNHESRSPVNAFLVVLLGR